MMQQIFIFKTGDIVRIVDKWSGIADPAEYTVQGRFTAMDLMGDSLKMYELECEGRPALVQEGMLEMIRSANPFRLVEGAEV